MYEYLNWKEKICLCQGLRWGT